MKLLLTLPYHTKDVELMKKCILWMKELRSNYDPHSCLLVADSGVPHETKIELHKLAKTMFPNVESISVRIPADKQKWPLAPNLMFYFAARQIQEAYKLPWLWFEPDAVPLKPTWLNDIAESYEKCPKRFMGSHIPSKGEPELPPVHLAGCAVYPADAYVGLNQFASADKAFDIASAAYTVPRSVNCPIMQHFWGKRDLSPVFAETKDMLDPENMVTLDFLYPDSVMFHRCKDGSLIDLLIKRKNTPPANNDPVKKTSPAKTVSEPVKT